MKTKCSEDEAVEKRDKIIGRERGGRKGEERTRGRGNLFWLVDERSQLQIGVIRFKKWKGEERRGEEKKRCSEISDGKKRIKRGEQRNTERLNS